MWRTKLTSIAEEPLTSSTLLIHDLNTGTWMTFPDETPFRCMGLLLTVLKIWNTKCMYV
jgi:hypothetical protein